MNKAPGFDRKNEICAMALADPDLKLLRDKISPPP
jgi:hypothetical protein